jgi:hypothetical protein
MAGLQEQGSRISTLENRSFVEETEIIHVGGAWVEKRYEKGETIHIELEVQSGDGRTRAEDLINSTLLMQLSGAIKESDIIEKRADGTSSFRLDSLTSINDDLNHFLMILEHNR